MLKIAIIGCYYGNFPVWIQYWLKSCSTNPAIDFFLVTDIELNNIPNNVYIIPYSLVEVKQLAERKLGISVSLNTPYKLCDLKPCYGLVFEDFLKKYDYWGHCDFDLIWGDILGFVSRYHIEKYEKFLPLGHLSLYKNTTEVNNRFRLSGSNCGSFKEVFANDEGHAFDEIDGIYSIYLKHGFSMFCKRIFAEIKTYHKRFKLKFIDKNYRHQVFFFKDGKVMRAFEENGLIKYQEFIYIHFRRQLQANDRSWEELDDFYISNNGFEKLQSIPSSIVEIEKHNKNPGGWVEFIETFSFIIKNLFKIKTKIENELLSFKQKI